MRSSLLWKHVAVTLVIIATVIAVVWVAIDYLAADYFMTLMKQYHISPTDSHHMFVQAVHRYLLWACLGALVLAVGFSVLLTKTVLKPLSRMMVVADQIAAGEYGVRVPQTSRDEVGQLAAAFNHMADNLQHIEHLRRTMVSDVAHELRTPLTNLQGYLEALRDGVTPPSYKTFQMLHDETLRLVALSESLLQLTKADAARMQLQLEAVDLCALVNQVMGLFDAQFNNRRLSVQRQLPAGGIVVRADPDKLVQAIRNMLQNALQFSQPGGQVAIAIQRISDGIKLTVSNTGEGIPSDELPFIFERFYRGEKSRSRQHGGAGIGLSIVKELITAHGGRVGAESEAELTHVWFALPA